MTFQNSTNPMLGTALNMAVNSDASPSAPRRTPPRYVSNMNRAFLITCLATSSFAAMAVAPKGCFEMSTAMEGQCLRKELAEENKVLARTMTSLRAGLNGQTFWSANPEMDRNARERLVKALNNADSAWKKLVAAECYELLDGSYIGGNGGINAGLRCDIERTRLRILELKKSEPYQWILVK